MMLYLCITLPFVLAAWLLYCSRNALLCVGRWFLRRRYEVEWTGIQTFDAGKQYLIIPNHPAIVDPLLLVPELHHKGLDVCPLVDESFFSIGLARHILALFQAVRVPDFRRANFRPILKARPTYRSSAKRAKALSYTILALLTSGENVLLYPSGHITTDGREDLGNRQLAYNTISELPDTVEVIGIRIRGLYGSMWSRAGRTAPPPFVRTMLRAVLFWPASCFKRKRSVGIHAEDLTGRVLEWRKLPRAEFDRMLERWYNADLESRGMRAELPT